MFKFWEKVEEAEATRPPEGSMKKRVEEEMFWRMNGLPVCPERVFSVRMLAVLDVAAMVTIDLASGVVVPIPTLSVWVVRRTRVPSSVHPETLEAEIAPQITLPEESVVRALEEEHVPTVDILNPPAMTSSPLKVLVAELVCNIFPPEMVSPESDERPDAEMPPANVEVAVEEELNPPPAWSSRATESELANVEEAEA